MRYTRYLAVALALAAPCAGRPDGVGGHHGDHGAGHHVEHGASAASAPSTGYAQPATGYDTPSTGYQEPASSYDSYEQPSYATGSSGYESPSATGYENYEASAPGYGEVETSTGGFDMSTLLVPILIIAGLALLFPSVRTVPVTGTGRKRREAGGKHTHCTQYTDKTDNTPQSLLIKTGPFCGRAICAPRTNLSCPLTGPAAGRLPTRLVGQRSFARRGKSHLNTGRDMIHIIGCHVSLAMSTGHFFSAFLRQIKRSIKLEFNNVSCTTSPVSTKLAIFPEPGRTCAACPSGESDSLAPRSGQLPIAAWGGRGTSGAAHPA